MQFALYILILRIFRICFGEKFMIPYNLIFEMIKNVEYLKKRMKVEITDFEGI